ncbi:divalent metal cation transporter [Isoptericola sp. NPDC019482]|uniref:NRAMP family divalent metal transporter n=1 Tax=Isoptericola sp. NPDC019482 TaxID=3154688 RepID=UPI00348B2FCB
MSQGSGTTTLNAPSDEAVRPEQIPLPRGRGLITTVGPGLVLAMTFLGTGDLVSSSVSGANYAYLLVWTLVISLVARTFIVSSIAKYTLMNRHGDTQILEGFHRILPWLPGFMAGVVLVAGFVTQATFLKACAIGLYQLTGGSWGGEWGTFVCAVVMVGVTLVVITSRRQFTILEYIARFASVLMIGAFVYALFKIGTFDVAGFFQGLFTFQTSSETTGAFGPIVIACATIGTIAGNMPNLLYSGFMKDKGWVGPRYRKLQQFDLMSGMLPLLLINLLFWVVAAEFAHPRGLSISDEGDLSHMMELIVGPVGPYILWFCIFAAAASSFPSETRGFAQLAVNGLHLSTRSGQKWLGRDEKDPKFRWIQIVVFTVVPIVASLPHAPNLIALNVVGTSVSTVLSLPFIVIALVILTSSKKYMFGYAVNKRWQIGALGVLGVIAIVVGVQIAISLPTQLGTAFSG